MRTGLATILVVVALVTGFGAPVSAQIAWQKDVTQALANAKAQRKYVFLLLTAPERCPPCRRLEGEILTDPSVKSYLQKYYLPVKVNADTDYGKALKQRYGKEGRGIPNMAVLAPTGARLGAMAGCARDAQAFLRNLTAITRGQQI